MIYLKKLIFLISLFLTFSLFPVQKLKALPDFEDIPEEILRGEIVTEARSPIDGQPVTLAEYVELQKQLQTSKFPPNLSPEVKYQIFILELLSLLRLINPF